MLIAIAVVGGGIIAAIVLTSGSDTQETAEEATNIGGIAVFEADCRFSGTPIAVLHNFAAGTTGTLARGTGELLPANLHNTGGFVAQIRTVSGSEFLSEQAHGADFTGDGIRDDRIPTDSRRVGFYDDAQQVPNQNPGNANIALDETLNNNGWNNILGTTAQNNNRIQLFVNRASECWGLRRV